MTSPGHVEWVIPPLHSILGIGDSLPPDYFSPGTYVWHGVETGSLWAIAYYKGCSYRFERVGLGAAWVLKKVEKGA